MSDFDTQELNEIRRLIGEDVPDAKPETFEKKAGADEASTQPSENPSDFNLDDILADVGGVVDKTRAEQEQEREKRQREQRRERMFEPSAAEQPEQPPVQATSRQKPQESPRETAPAAPEPENVPLFKISEVTLKSSTEEASGTRSSFDVSLEDEEKKPVWQQTPLPEPRAKSKKKKRRRGKNTAASGQAAAVGARSAPTAAAPEGAAREPAAATAAAAAAAGAAATTAAVNSQGAVKAAETVLEAAGATAAIGETAAKSVGEAAAQSGTKSGARTAQKSASAPDEPQDAKVQRIDEVFQTGRLSEKAQQTVAGETTQPQTIADAVDADRTPEDAAARKRARARRRADRKIEKQSAYENSMLDSDDEEDIQIRDPEVALCACKSKARGLAVRSLFVLLCAVFLAYLTLAPGYHWPLPNALSFANSQTLTACIMVIVEFIAMFIGIDVVGSGVYNFFVGHPDRSSLVALTLFVSIVHCLVVILVPDWDSNMPFTCVAVLLLFAMMQETKARYMARYRVYKAATMSEQPVGVYVFEDGQSKKNNCVVKCRMESTEPFLREIERTDSVARFSGIYAPLMMVATLVLALIVSIGRAAPGRFFWAFSALLSVSAPIGILCAHGPAFKNISRRLLAEGAAVVGVASSDRIHKTRRALIEDSDVFPAGSITVDGVKDYGICPPAKLLAYTAAVTNRQGAEIGRIFSELLREQYGKPLRAHNFQSYESGGLAADVAGDSVLVGTASFLTKLGIPLRSTRELENGVFVAVNNRVAGVFLLGYHPLSATYGALQIFKSLRVKPLLTMRDFNVTPAMVESLFELRADAIGEPEADEERVLTDADAIHTERVCGILTRDGIAPYAVLVQMAHKLSSAVHGNLLVGLLAGICGLLLVFYLSFIGAIAAVSAQNIFLYLLLWYLPVCLLTYQTMRK